MTIRSVGYDGSIGEVDWAAWLAPYLGSVDMVASPTAFRVTPTTGLSVQVAPGLAHGWGVTDVSDAAEVLQLEPVSSGSRYDCVVLRRSWEGTSTTPSGAATGGRTTIGYVKGGTTKALPSLASTGGLLTEQPLALVQVTASTSTVQLADDLRATSTKAAWVRSMLAMTGPAGTRYALEPDGRRYVRAADSSGAVVTVPEWEPPAATAPVIPKIASGTTPITTNANGSATFPHNLPWTPQVVHLTPRLATSSGMVSFYVSAAAGAVNNRYVNVTAKIVTATGQKPYEGPINALDWVAYG